MRINYGDTGLVVNYIQMFLKEYYSKYIDVEYSYSKNTHHDLIKFLHSPDSIDTLEMHDKLCELLFELRDPDTDVRALDIFKIEERIDEFVLISKDKNLKGYPTIDNESVKLLQNILYTAVSLMSLSYGWHVINYSYRDYDDKCEIIISKMNKNIIPKSAVYDLLNLYETKYTEMIFAASTQAYAWYFSSLYNFEIATAQYPENYSLGLPNTSGVSIERQESGEYALLVNGEVKINNFRGLKTFVSNQYVNEGQLYAIYVKIPKNSKFDPSSNESYVYVCTSSDIGNKLSIGDSDLNFDAVNPITLVASNQEYLCLLIRPVISGNQKICVSIYDPDNELDSILIYQFDESQLKDPLREELQSIGSYALIYPSSSNYVDANFHVNIITPEDYFSNPFVIHEKLLSYILEATVHEFSREEDIILIQKLATKFGYTYTSDNYGVYDESLKQFIKQIQSGYRNKDGKLMEYGKGYTDPDTESILNLHDIGGDYQ